MKIREADVNDLKDVLYVERLAFGSEAEPDLVRALLSDPSAGPVVSLVAIEKSNIVGHILFSRLYFDQSSMSPKSYLLAPLAVLPPLQNRGIGGALISAGLERLNNMDVSLVFVLGYPNYYKKHGFEPAARYKLIAPYPIPRINADAWMVRALKADILENISGKLKCADSLDKPEYWRE